MNAPTSEHMTTSGEANDVHGEDRRSVAEALLGHDNFLLVTHARPDGDAIGSTAGLQGALQRLGKKAVGYVYEGVPEKLAFIPYSGAIRDTLPDWTPEVTVMLDCGGVDRPGPGFSPAGRLINIDHHASNDRFGDWNYVDVGASAVGVQIGLLLDDLGIEPDAEIATCLYTAILTDTGGFRFSNTTQRALEVAGRMIRAGADPATISRDIFERRTRGEIELTARCFDRVRYECGGRFAWSELLASDYKEVGGRVHEPEGLSSELRSIEGVELSALFTELDCGGVRASLRGRGGVDCSELAAIFGGGGHRNAAGVTLAGADFATERDRIVHAACVALNKAES